MDPSAFEAAHFSAPASSEEQRAVFARSVSNVVVEITSYCNRQCTYCPISTVDRLSDRQILPESVFTKLITDLSEIGYEKRICFNLYNEPTADRELLLARIRETRGLLPRSWIYFSSNGDYLTEDYVQALVDAGLSEMWVTLHPPKGKAYDDASAVARFTEFAARLGKAVKIETMVPGRTVEGLMTLHQLPIHVFTTNYDTFGQDRAGSIRKLTNARFRRTSPCARPFEDFTVSYDGTIFPCCQMFVDNPQHRAEYAVGRLTDFRDVFEAYSSTALAGWRRELLRFDLKQAPCDTCTESCRSPQAGEVEALDRVYERHIGPLPNVSLQQRVEMPSSRMQGGILRIRSTAKSGQVGALARRFASRLLSRAGLPRAR